MNRASIAVAAGALTLAGISAVYGIAPAAPVYSAPVAAHRPPLRR
jgi:hypothetical protein